MQYLIIEKLQDNTNYVVLGPMNWRPTYFQNCLLDDLEIEFKVPLSNDSEQQVIVNENVKIIPVTDTGIQGDINPKIQFAQGPYYTYFEDRAEIHWIPENKPIDSIKAELKSIVAANRYKYEILGIKITIQNKEVIALTNRGDRDLYLQAYQLGKDNVNWKFGTEFLVLSNAELGQLVLAVTTHVQNVFDWESGKVSEIEMCTTLEELNDVILVSDNPDWEPVINPIPVV